MTEIKLRRRRSSYDDGDRVTTTEIGTRRRESARRRRGFATSPAVALGLLRAVVEVRPVDCYDSNLSTGGWTLDLELRFRPRFPDSIRNLVYDYDADQDPRPGLIQDSSRIHPALIRDSSTTHPRLNYDSTTTQPQLNHDVYRLLCCQFVTPMDGRGLA